jgi:hypothetical protein
MAETKRIHEIEVTGLTIHELDEAAKVAVKIFDGWTLPEGITARQLFIVAFLKGREYTLEELGILDEIEETSEEKAREFLNKYFE